MSSIVSPHTRANSFVIGTAVINTHTRLMVGIRSQDGLVVGLAPATLEVLGSIPKREEPGETGRHSVLKYRVPHGSQPRPGWAPHPLMVGISSPDGLVVGLAPATLEFWV